MKYRRVARLGSMDGRWYSVDAPDWTRGCIALGTDAAIAIVADWVKEHRFSIVDIY
jgi:hypothetical protein